MTDISSSAETYLLLEAMHIEDVTVGLMGIPAVATHEAVESRDEAVFAGWIREIESFEIFAEGILSCNLQSFNFTTIIDALSRVELLPGSMGNNFMSRRSAFAGSGGFVVVALNMKNEETSPLLHPIIDGLIFIELLKIEEVTADRTALVGDAQVEQEWQKYHNDDQIELFEETTHSDYCYTDTSDEEDCEDQNWDVPGGSNWDGSVLFGCQSGVQSIVVVISPPSEGLEEVLASCGHVCVHRDVGIHCSCHGKGWCHRHGLHRLHHRLHRLHRHWHGLHGHRHRLHLWLRLHLHLHLLRLHLHLLRLQRWHVLIGRLAIEVGRLVVQCLSEVLHGVEGLRRHFN